jgi:hypothetical protein
VLISVPSNPLPAPARSIRARRPFLGAFVALAFFPCLVLAQPQPPTANGSAFAERLVVRVAPFLGPLVVVQSGPLPLASGASDVSFSDSAQVASIVVSTPLTGKVLETGLLLASTQGTGAEVLSESSIEQTRLQLVSLLRLQADAIESTAHLNGCDTDPSGATRLVNARLRGPLGLAIDVPVNPAPNTVLLDLAGVRVVLNEQIVTNSALARSLTVNAVHVSVDALLGLGLLSADVVLSQSRAEVPCGPIIIE